MCKFAISIEIGGKLPRLIVRQSAAGNLVQVVELESVGQIERIKHLLDVARENFPAGRPPDAIEPPKRETLIDGVWQEED